MAMYASGYSSISFGLRLTLLPLMGTMDIDSTPPATDTRVRPACTLSAACAMACRPLEQKRLMVSAGTLFGHFARNTAFRARFRPCSASGMAQPRITSSTSSAFRPGTRSSAATMTAAAKSSGRVLRSVPLSARPTGVRTADAMITLRGNAIFCLQSVTKRLVVHQHELHALLALGLAAQREECFTFEIQEMLLGQKRARGDRPATQDVRDLVGNQRVVRGGEAAFDHGPNASADGFLRVVTGRGQERR